jgi:hypothetical protein
MQFLKSLTSSFAPIAFVALAASGCQVTVTSAPSGSGVTGVYDSSYATMAGSTQPTQLNLQQTGNAVEGAYMNGAKLNGVVNDHRVTGTWTNEGKSGTFEFDFNADFSGFNGYWATPEASGKQYAWNATKRK